MGDLAAYAGLFLSALVAATLVPAGSEAVLVGLVLADRHPVAALLTVASVGNVLGSCVNYALGRGASRLAGRWWFPARPAQLERASGWYARWGHWSLLLAWAPVIGDPITVAAGLLREAFWRFLILVAVAKVGRYAAVVALIPG